MLLELPDEILCKIVNKLDQYNIYKFIKSVKIIYKMNFQALLIGQLFKYTFSITREECAECITYGYTLKDYLYDLKSVVNYTQNKKNKCKYIIKKMCKFNCKQEDLYEIKSINYIKVHPIYNIPLIDYNILKLQKSQILALIY